MVVRVSNVLEINYNVKICCIVFCIDSSLDERLIVPLHDHSILTTDLQIVVLWPARRPAGALLQTLDNKIGAEERMADDRACDSMSKRARLDPTNLDDVPFIEYEVIEYIEIATLILSNGICTHCPSGGPIPMTTRDRPGSDTESA